MEYPESEIATALNNCGSTQEIISRKEHLGLVTAWTGIYGAQLKHASYRKAGRKAMILADENCDGDFLLVPCRDPGSRRFSAVWTAFRCCSEILPDLISASHLVDIFLSPEDLSWTLYYGHEVDVFGGPVFMAEETNDTLSPERRHKAGF